MTRTAVIAALVGPVLATGVVPQHVQAAIPCRKQGVRLIEQSSHARIFGDCRGREMRYYARLVRSDARVRLDTPHGHGAITQAALAGRFAAYVETDVAKERVRFSVAVLDLRSRRVAHRWNEDSQTPVQRFYGVTDLGLTAGGSVAWIDEFNSDSDSTLRYEIRKTDDAGEAVVLDGGPAIDRTSLAVSGRTLYWTNANRAFSAALSD